MADPLCQGRCEGKDEHSVGKSQQRTWKAMSTIAGATDISETFQCLGAEIIPTFCGEGEAIACN